MGAWLTGAGLTLIGVSVLVIDSKTAFPGVAAWLPCIGAGTIILGGSIAPGSWPSWCLSAWPLVRIGKLSYSWYLWHWPLLAIARTTALGEVSFARDALIALIALGLAEITYRFVEDPIRRGKPWPFTKSGSAVAGGAALMLLTVFTGVRPCWFVPIKLSKRIRYSSRWPRQKRTTVYSLDECVHFERPFRALHPPKIVFWAIGRGLLR